MNTFPLSPVQKQNRPEHGGGFSQTLKECDVFKASSLLPDLTEHNQLAQKQRVKHKHLVSYNPHNKRFISRNT